MAVYGIILAGGAGRRMGGADKAALRLCGQTLMARATGRLGLQVAALAVAGPDRAEGPVALPDPVAGRAGPLAGILAGLDWAARAGGKAVVSVPVDSPFFPRDLAVRLEAAARAAGVPLAMAAGRGPDGTLRVQPAFGLWPVALRDDLRAALAAGTRRVRAWAEAHDAALAEFPAAEPDPFFNINTAEDLARAEAMLIGANQ